jgi:hypothetical protein
MQAMPMDAPDVVGTDDWRVAVEDRTDDPEEHEHKGNAEEEGLLSARIGRHRR